MIHEELSDGIFDLDGFTPLERASLELDASPALCDQTARLKAADSPRPGRVQQSANKDIVTWTLPQANAFTKLSSLIGNKATGEHRATKLTFKCDELKREDVVSLIVSMAQQPMNSFLGLFISAIAQEQRLEALLKCYRMLDKSDSETEQECALLSWTPFANGCVELNGQSHCIPFVILKYFGRSDVTEDQLSQFYLLFKEQCYMSSTNALSKHYVCLNHRHYTLTRKDNFSSGSEHRIVLAAEMTGFLAVCFSCLAKKALQADANRWEGKTLCKRQDGSDVLNYCVSDSRKVSRNRHSSADLRNAACLLLFRCELCHCCFANAMDARRNASRCLRYGVDLGLSPGDSSFDTLTLNRFLDNSASAIPCSHLNKDYYFCDKCQCLLIHEPMILAPETGAVCTSKHCIPCRGATLACSNISSVISKYDQYVSVIKFDTPELKKTVIKCCKCRQTLLDKETFSKHLAHSNLTCNRCNKKFANVCFLLSHQPCRSQDNLLSMTEF